ncbi:phosphatidylserine decarboxylase [Diplodia corticola]|uniref:Phosphatidylserine decarboxylase n=1 Tax=Diplodia corticola TaxID=236234 RepID=A0A1J9QLP3_9PEZI|nr:phosphatidylserine decarboxylase [Diplodia corticola]OJD29376.1 phosphatidylserine decarboxylase [Diplodia corticola]
MDFSRYSPIIILLQGWLDLAEPGGLCKAVESAKKKVPAFMEKVGIHKGDDFLKFANDLLKWIPHEDFKGKNIYQILALFYFILDQPPLKKCQTEIHPNQIGKDLTWLSSWIVVYAQLVGLHMDTPNSLTQHSLETFKKTPSYRYGEALVPKRGFRTFNEFFTRRLKPGMRPISSPLDDTVIVYPADCRYDDSTSQNAFNVRSAGVVDIKGIQWAISSLLHGSKYHEEFHGGIWMHAFLNTFNYHRQHAPVAGTVCEAINIQGAAYLEVDVKTNPIREFFASAEQQPEMEDNAGYQFLQSQAVIIIDNPVVGKVAVLPIGMAQVSSVRLSVQEGDILCKGDEISTFALGGSDIICVFQRQAGLTVNDLVPSPEGTYSKYGTILARAKPLGRQNGKSHSGTASNSRVQNGESHHGRSHS